MNYSQFRSIFINDEFDLQVAQRIVEGLNDNQVKEMLAAMEMDPARLKRYSKRQREEAAGLQRTFHANLSAVKNELLKNIKLSDGSINMEVLPHVTKTSKILGQLQKQIDLLDPPKLSSKTVNQLFSIGRTQETIYPEDEVLEEIENRMMKHQIKRYQQGPLNLMTYTKILKSLVEAILDGHVFENLGKAYDYILKDLATGQEYDVIELLKHANLSHILLDNDYLDRYVAFSQGVTQFKANFTELTTNNIPTMEDFAVRDPHNKHHELHYAEKLAINVYTGSAYGPINNLLRLAPTFDSSDQVAELKELLVHSVVCASGLNRTMEKHKKSVFRGDNNLPGELLVQRKEDAGLGNSTYMHGFISASANKLNDAWAGPVRSVFTNGVYGVDISALSYHPHEAEVLLLPTHVIWEGSMEEDDVHYFKARTIWSPSLFLDEVSEESSPVSSVKHN